MRPAEPETLDTEETVEALLDEIRSLQQNLRNLT